MTITAPPKLHPIQIDAIKWGWGTTGKGDNGGRPFRMGTGTGKNAVQAYLAKLFCDVKGRVLLLHPNSCLEQTMEEFEKWLGEEFVEKNIQLLYAKPTKWAQGMTVKQRAEVLNKKKGTKPIVLLGHEALPFAPIRQAIKQDWDAIFVDEASRFRRWSSRTRTLLSLRAYGKHRYILSGSFVTKSPDDLYYPFLFCDKAFFPYNHETFKHEWCELGGWTGMVPLGTLPHKKKLLTDYLDRICFTANLSDMRSDMPDRPDVITRWVELRGQQLQAYHALNDTLTLRIERMSDEEYRLNVATYLTQIQRLLEIASGFTRNTEGDIVFFPHSAKTEETVEAFFNDPLTTIVWCWWEPEMKLVQRAFAQEGIASVTSHDKNWRTRFKAGEVPVAILQMAAGGYGLNLDEAHRMLYHSLHWSLDNVLQSQERNWRYTTWHDKMVTHVVARHTADVRVRETLMQGAETARPLTRADALRILKA